MTRDGGDGGRNSRLLHIEICNARNGGNFQADNVLQLCVKIPVRLYQVLDVKLLYILFNEMKHMNTIQVN